MISPGVGKGSGCWATPSGPEARRKRMSVDWLRTFMSSRRCLGERASPGKESSQGATLMGEFHCLCWRGERPGSGGHADLGHLTNLQLGPEKIGVLEGKGLGEEDFGESLSPGSVELHAVIVALPHESDFILDPDQPVHEITHDRITLEVGMILAESKKSLSHCAISPDGSIDLFWTEVPFLQDPSQAGNVPVELPFVLKISFGYRFKVWDQVHSLLQGNLDIGVSTFDPVAKKHQIVKHQDKRA